MVIWFYCTLINAVVKLHTMHPGLLLPTMCWCGLPRQKQTAPGDGKLLPATESYSCKCLLFNGTVVLRDKGRATSFHAQTWTRCQPSHRLV